MRIRAKEIRKTRKREWARVHAKINAVKSVKPAAPARVAARPPRPVAAKAPTTAPAPRPRAKATSTETPPK